VIISDKPGEKVIFEVLSGGGVEITVLGKRLGGSNFLEWGGVSVKFPLATALALARQIVVEVDRSEGEIKRGFAGKAGSDL
jgi:hypothetical protein